MNDHTLRSDLRTSETLRDDTHRNLASFKSAGEEADRQQMYIQADTEGGVGDEEIGASRHSTRGSLEDLHKQNDLNARRTHETAQEFNHNVARSARDIRS